MISRAMRIVLPWTLALLAVGSLISYSRWSVNLRPRRQRM